jgi:hypothetical protein
MPLSPNKESTMIYKKRYVFILNELNVFVLIAFVLARRETYVYRSRPFFKLFRMVLNNLVSFMKCKGWTQSPEMIPDSGPWLRGYPATSNAISVQNTIYMDIHEGISGRINVEAPLAMNEYYYVAKDWSCMYIEEIVNDILLLKWARETVRSGNIQFIGLYSDLREASRIYFSDKSFQPGTNRFFSGLINFISTLMGLGYILVWMAKRIRPTGVAPESYLMVADQYMYWMDHIYQSLVDQDEDLLYFDRYQGRRPHPYEDPGRQASLARRFRQCTINDGRVTIAGFFEIFLLVAGHSARMLRLFWDRDPVLFGIILFGIVKRGMYRAFYNRFRVKYSFLLDEISPDHMIRGLELRRIGGISVSAQHGVPYTPYGHPSWLYVDCDIYFIHGWRIYEKYYRATWPEKMRVVTVGSLRAKPEHLRQAPTRKRSPDILFFFNISLVHEQIQRDLILLAKSFPDRNVLVKTKRGIGGKMGKNITEETCYAILEKNQPPNLKILPDETNTYELFLTATYAIVLMSTAIVEATQYRCISFCLDFNKNLKDVYYRHFPELMVDDIAHAGRRIRAIEAGEETYDFEHFGDLTDLTVQDPVVHIKEALELSHEP